MKRPPTGHHHIEMKQLRTYFAILIMLWTTMGKGTAADDKIIALRADEWCPYNCSPGSDRPGILIEMAQSIFGEQGYKIDYKIMKWNAAINLARKGRIHGIVGATRNEATDFIFHDGEIVLNTNSFFTLKDHQWTYEKIEDLAQKDVKVGHIKGYVYTPEFEGMRKKHPAHFHRHSGDKALVSLIKMLQRKRISAIIEDEWVFAHTVQKMGLSRNEFRNAGSLTERETVFMAFSPAASKRELSLKLAQWFGEGLERMKKNGELKKLMNKYGVDN